MSTIKTADQIMKELSECENPVTSSSLKSVAISKLKQERDKLLAERAAMVADLRGILIPDNFTYQTLVHKSHIEAIINKYGSIEVEG